MFDFEGNVRFKANFRIRMNPRWIDLIPIVFTIAEYILL